jgi:hypothetical protein
MIKIAGSAKRCFVFPADLQAAYEFYSDFRRTFSFLDHITILHHYGEGEYRMLYSATELGIYRVRVLCDLQAERDYRQGVLRIRPLERIASTRSKVGMYSLSGHGYFNSESLFKPNGNQTNIEYKLRLRARLPIPMGLRFMPRTVINEIARNITQWRINEIAEGFIDRSLRAYGNPHN